MIAIEVMIESISSFESTPNLTNKLEKYSLNPVEILKMDIEKNLST